MREKKKKKKNKLLYLLSSSLVRCLSALRWCIFPQLPHARCWGGATVDCDVVSGPLSDPKSRRKEKFYFFLPPSRRDSHSFHPSRGLADQCQVCFSFLFSFFHVAFSSERIAKQSTATACLPSSLVLCITMMLRE